MGLFNIFKKKEQSVEPLKVEQKPVEYSSDKISESVNYSSDKGVFSVIDIYNITGVGMVITGKVISGSINKMMISIINGKKISIKTMESMHKQKEQIVTGESAGINVQGEGISEIRKGITLEFN